MPLNKVISFKHVLICLTPLPQHVQALWEMTSLPQHVQPPRDLFWVIKIGLISVQIMFSTMACEMFNRDLEMVNAGCFSPEEPLTTQFLLPAAACCCQGQHILPPILWKDGR